MKKPSAGVGSGADTAVVRPNVSSEQDLGFRSTATGPARYVVRC